MCRYSENFSQFKTIKYGVPLVPVFNIYLNNLFSLDTEGQIISFTHDTAVFYNANEWTNLLNKAQEDFLKIKEWFDSWKLTINFDKTQYVPFSIQKIKFENIPPLSQTTPTTTFSILPTTITNYLGLIIDCNLKWDHHIKKLTGKLRSLLHLCRHYKTMVNVKQLKSIYYALVESQLSYGSIAWGGAYNHHISPIIILQKWILKIIYGKDKKKFPQQNFLTYRKSLISNNFIFSV